MTSSPAAASPAAAAPPMAVVVLAAGVGSRMRSALPKPLHRVGGLPLLGHALAAFPAAKAARRVVVVGPGEAGAQVAAAARAAAPDAAIAVQAAQRGTGDALASALPALAGFREGTVLVVYADTPLLKPQTLAAMAAARAAGAGVVALGFEPPEPGRYGRLVEDRAGLARIVEAADATADELATPLCNAGAMAVDAARLPGWLGRLDAGNAQGELYLTDLVGLARADGAPCAVVRCGVDEATGVNSRAELAAAEAAFQARARAAAMAGGATLTAPETVFLSHDTRLGRDVTVGPNVVFAPGVTVEDGAEIRAFSHLEGCVVRAGAIVGPFARLRPGAEVGPGAHVGNFVEIKNAVLGEGAKANHLAYVGDATVGAGANIGAGAITCNYDGANKHRTEIGAGAFIGSNSALVAPVTIGAGAYVASGSVVTRDVAADALAVARARQVDKPGLAATLRARLRRAAERP
ncbi:bifunctional UDP-N-acetylglucosamine diphosphorylase/glucosamine-1-phosphate N-acetyltransferase GlmU [Rubrimonas cliftonensis]|uniref:Bifunctional protein GlmU n=1 Tax=Rubrimonas cliftonensis TaxID=89524 RepID=A0A1H4CT01_9RHOB|nr:bifunctional UDP-N-acetylglucosamine diphosphorylase/glucosamine-1-phosphate N-acetyltransferase GlmU [Rubrimonas cliftonensis]SEA63486.1 UDP-N-acetylglucosamine pyrophosphorylase /glucosamine-1-phosphate N-acetyltransferase [Rubrimonas cliftonensis]